MEVNVKELQKEMIDHDIKTISELSEKTGVDRNILGKIINKESRPSAQTMDKLTLFFGWSSQRAGEIFFAKKLTQ